MIDSKKIKKIHYMSYYLTSRQNSLNGSCQGLSLISSLSSQNLNPSKSKRIIGSSMPMKMKTKMKETNKT